VVKRKWCSVTAFCQRIRSHIAKRVAVKRGNVIVRPDESRFDRFLRNISIPLTIVGFFSGAIVLIDRWMHVDNEVRQEAREREAQTLRMLRRLDATQRQFLLLEESKTHSDRPSVSAVAFVDRNRKQAFSLTCCGSYELELAIGDSTFDFASPIQGENVYIVDFNTGEISGNLKMATTFVVRGRAEVLYGGPDKSDRFLADLTVQGFKVLGNVSYKRSEMPVDLDGDIDLPGPRQIKRLVIDDPETSLSFGSAMGASIVRFNIFETSPNADGTRITPAERENPPAERFPVRRPLSVPRAVP
jgi:hypothetical protein